MTVHPLVSIVIPLYNGANYVECALKTAFAQDYDNIEIIVVNDGSTDDGAGRDICMKYADRITYLEKANGGCSSALNYGIRAANGEYISWLSHDDLYASNKISHQVSLLNREGIDREKTIICNRGGLIDGEGKELYHPYRGENCYLDSLGFFRYLLFKQCVNGCGLLIPKKLFENGLQFDEGMRFVLDWNLWLKMAASGASIYIDREELVKNRVHGGQVTAKQKQLHQVEANKTVEDLFAFLQDKPVAFMVELYYFAYATERKCDKDIYHYLKAKMQKINWFKAVVMRLKIKSKKTAKRIYHAIR